MRFTITSGRGLAIVVAALALTSVAPAAAAPTDAVGRPTPTRELRSPDALDAASAARGGSPIHVTRGGFVAPARDPRSPDAIDAASPRRPVTPIVITPPASSGGFDWADAAIGAAAAVALALLAFGLVQLAGSRGRVAR